MLSYKTPQKTAQKIMKGNLAYLQLAITMIFEMPIIALGISEGVM